MYDYFFDKVNGDGKVSFLEVYVLEPFLGEGSRQEFVQECSKV